MLQLPQLLQLLQLLHHSDTLLATTAASSCLDSLGNRAWLDSAPGAWQLPLWHFSSRACLCHFQGMTALPVAQPTFPAIGPCSSPDLIDSPPVAPTHVPSTTSPTTHRHYLSDYSLRLKRPLLLVVCYFRLLVFLSIHLGYVISIVYSLYTTDSTLATAISSTAFSIAQTRQLGTAKRTYPAMPLGSN